MATIRFPTLQEIDRWNRTARLVLDRANLTQPRKPPIPSNSTAIQRLLAQIGETNGAIGPNRFWYRASIVNVWLDSEFRWIADVTAPELSAYVKNRAEDTNTAGSIRLAIPVTFNLTLAPIPPGTVVEVVDTGNLFTDSFGTTHKIYEFDLPNDLYCGSVAP